MAGTLTISTLSDGTNSTSSTNCIQGSAKAWVNFNGVTTATIRSAYNVSSVTRTATGRYTVNFTNAFANTNYCTNYSIQYQSGVNFLDNIGMGDVTTTSASFVATEAGTYYDVVGFNVVVNSL
jgi:hypothetical protein